MLHVSIFDGLRFTVCCMLAAATRPTCTCVWDRYSASSWITLSAMLCKLTHCSFDCSSSDPRVCTVCNKRKRHKFLRSKGIHQLLSVTPVIIHPPTYHHHHHLLKSFRLPLRRFHQSSIRHWQCIHISRQWNDLLLLLWLAPERKNKKSVSCCKSLFQQLENGTNNSIRITMLKIDHDLVEDGRWTKWQCRTSSNTRALIRSAADQSSWERNFILCLRQQVKTRRINHRQSLCLRHHHHHLLLLLLHRLAPKPFVVVSMRTVFRPHRSKVIPIHGCSQEETISIRHRILA